MVSSEEVILFSTIVESATLVLDTAELDAAAVIVWVVAIVIWAVRYIQAVGSK